MKYTISKTFLGYPFAHRQPKHKGHCALIHGHNWDFTVEMSAPEGYLDENDFVYDFGKFAWLKEWLTDMFDHTCVINADDPLLENFKEMDIQNMLNLRIVPSASAEGLAKLVYDYIKTKDLGDHVDLVSVTVHEDYKNTAKYSI